MNGKKSPRRWLIAVKPARPRAGESERVYRVAIGTTANHLTADELRRLRGEINAALADDEPEGPVG